MDHRNLLIDEVRGSIDFFLQFTNLEPNSRGYGLTVDSTKDAKLASIASTGYALTAWVIAAERGYLSREAAREITLGTLQTLYHRASHHRGFFAHFLHIDTAERFNTSEYSTIDTAICLNGVITAAAYFADDEIQSLAQQLLERVDWNFIIFERDGKTLFRMAYNPDRHGDYVTGEPGFISQWDMAAEQKMMYLQAAAHIDPDTARKLYAGFSRDTGHHDGQPVIFCPNGGLYIYQCSEAWLDARRYLDPDGVDWFNNTRLAAAANRGFCIENAAKYTTYHANSWALSSGDSPRGYAVFGSTPCAGTPLHNGTVSIWGALACMPYLPEETAAMAEYLFLNHPAAWGPYGFYDAYNLHVTPAWYSTALYGIDKGCSMIMIENYLSGLVWETYTGSPYIQRALALLGFTKREGVVNEPLYRGERPILAE